LAIGGAMPPNKPNLPRLLMFHRLVV
jgi:hypothetical protein